MSTTIPTEVEPAKMTVAQLKAWLSNKGVPTIKGIKVI